MSMAQTPLEVFRAKGIPHRRIEEWKYSDLRSVLDAETVAREGGVQWQVEDVPEQVEKTNIAADGIPGWAAKRFEAFCRTGPMEAAAWAFGANGVALRIPRGVRIAEPVRLELRSHGHGQVVVVVEEGASVALLETHFGDSEGLRNLSVSIVLEDGAELTHVRQAPFARALVAVETISVRVNGNARYRAHLADLGGKLSRIEFNVALDGAGAEADLSGVSVLGDGAHADVTTRIDHAVGDTTSRQLFKMAAGGHSRAVYQGKIVVHEGANGSDSRQTAKALLLGTRAEADLKPELEIFADDVKCAHGAAAGDLDADSLFYLRARGIPEHEARGLLIRAFLKEAVDEVADDRMRAAMWDFVEGGLTAAMKDTP